MTISSAETPPSSELAAVGTNQSEPAELLECDVIMKGGVTSGVIYPGALVEFSNTYRFRGVGGASAGAIGAAFAAAAELGRGSENGGFDFLATIPSELGDGGLLRLFKPQPSTAPLLSIFLAGLTREKVVSGREPIKLSGRQRFLSVLRELQKQFPRDGVLGATWGAVVLVVGVVVGVLLALKGAIVVGVIAGLIVLLAGACLLVVGWFVAMGIRLFRKLTIDLPANEFGISRGMSDSEDGGLTTWLSTRINTLANRPEPETAEPVTFGELWGDDPAAVLDARARKIDLRMITTCLSRSRPYELPWEARNFFFEVEVWKKLFPAKVIDVLIAASEASGEDSPRDVWIAKGADDRKLLRLPRAADMPIVVATRMSLSFPVLLSAIPLHAVDFGNLDTQAALAAFDRTKSIDTPTSGLVFESLWFTDGGLCSNFPISMFDSPLPTRPTFAINLGRLPKGATPSEDQSLNIDYAKTNGQGLLPSYRAIAPTGVAALGDFAAAALDTARNWQDNSYLDVPGFRDRIVRVNQSSSEGGLNLNMGEPVITELAGRGAAAARALVTQFTKSTYDGGKQTGWQNHRWIRYRALLAALPEFLAGFKAGHEVLDQAPRVVATSPPSKPLSVGARELGDTLSERLTSAATAVEGASTATLASMRDMPRSGQIRRVPEV